MRPRTHPLRQWWRQNQDYLPALAGAATVVWGSWLLWYLAKLIHKLPILF